MRAKLISNQCFYILLALFTVFCAIHTTHHDLDFRVYYKAGLQVLAHDTDFYNMVRDGGFSYRYGPSFPYPMALFALLNFESSRLVWGILSALAFAGAWFCFEDALVRRLGECVRAPGVRLLTLIMLIDPVLRNADQGNVNAFAFFTMAAAVMLSDRRQDFWASVIIGFGAMMKVYPGAIVVYFLFARRWRAFFMSAFATLFWTFILPAIVYGPSEMVRQIMGWAKILGDTGHYDYLEYINQGPSAVFGRIIGTGDVARILSVLIILAVFGVYLVWVRRKQDLMILFGAIALPFFVLTCVYIEYYLDMMPLLMTANCLLLTGVFTKTEKVLYGIRFLCVHLAVLAIIGRHLTETFGVYGNYLWGLVLLLALLAIALPRLASRKHLV